MNFLGLPHLPRIVVLAFLLNMTPGADTAYVVGRSIAQGRGAGLLSGLRIADGSCIHAFFAAVGLSALFAASSLAFAVVNIAGAAYLAYLGLRTLLTRRRRTIRPRGGVGRNGCEPIRLTLTACTWQQ